MSASSTENIVYVPLQVNCTEFNGKTISMKPNEKLPAGFLLGGKDFIQPQCGVPARPHQVSAHREAINGVLGIIGIAHSNGGIYECYAFTKPSHPRAGRTALIFPKIGNQYTVLPEYGLGPSHADVWALLDLWIAENPRWRLNKLV